MKFRVDRRATIGLMGAAAVGSLRFAQARALTQAPGTGADRDAPDFEDASSRLASGATTSTDLVRACLHRIDGLDRRGPALRAVIERNPDALRLAAESDAQRHRHDGTGRLDGIPVLLKDNIATGDRMCTSAGSLALSGAPAVRDAFLVRRLRAAGAVILGKTNLSEWANIRSDRSTSGLNQVSGAGATCQAKPDKPLIRNCLLGLDVSIAVAILRPYYWDSRYGNHRTALPRRHGAQSQTTRPQIVGQTDRRRDSSDQRGVHRVGWRLFVPSSAAGQGQRRQTLLHEKLGLHFDRRRAARRCRLGFFPRYVAARGARESGGLPRIV